MSEERGGYVGPVVDVSERGRRAARAAQGGGGGVVSAEGNLRSVPISELLNHERGNEARIDGSSCASKSENHLQGSQTNCPEPGGKDEVD